VAGLGLQAGLSRFCNSISSVSWSGSLAAEYFASLRPRSRLCPAPASIARLQISMWVLYLSMAQGLLGGVAANLSTSSSRSRHDVVLAILVGLGFEQGC